MALQKLLSVVEEIPGPRVLWSLQYSQQESAMAPLDKTRIQSSEAIIRLPQLSSNLAFDDSILGHVREAWQQVTDNVEGFMQFDERQDDAYDEDRDDH